MFLSAAIYTSSPNLNVSQVGGVGGCQILDLKCSIKASEGFFPFILLICRVFSAEQDRIDDNPNYGSLTYRCRNIAQYVLPVFRFRYGLSMGNKRLDGRVPRNSERGEGCGVPAYGLILPYRVNWYDLTWLAVCTSNNGHIFATHGPTNPHEVV